MSDIITKQEIMEMINPEYRYFFDLRIDYATADLRPQFTLLAEAINLFCKFTNINKKADLFFNFGNQGVAQSDAIILQYQINSPVIHVHYNNCIFFNLFLSAQYEHRIQIAMYLEELAHCYMNISDEVLVKKVTSAIYPCIKYNEKEDQYEINYD